MRETETKPTPPTRRSAMRFSLAALTAGLTVPAPAQTANPDARLIDLCDRLVAAETEQDLLADHDAYAPDYGPNHARYEHLDNERMRLTDLIDECPNPTSPAGQAAVARAALIWATRDSGGSAMSGDFYERLSVSLAESLAGGFVWPPRPGSCSTAQWAPPTSPQEIAAHAAAHDAWVTSVEAKVKADQEAAEAEFRRKMTPMLMTDDELRRYMEASNRLTAIAIDRRTEFEAEMARRGLA